MEFFNKNKHEKENSIQAKLKIRWFNNKKQEKQRIYVLIMTRNGSGMEKTFRSALRVGIKTKYRKKIFEITTIKTKE